MKYFKIIGAVQSIISKSNTIDEALKNGLKSIIETCNVDYAVFWYKDNKNKLHPYYWICPKDLTQSRYNPGEGVVGEVYASQKAVRLFDYQKEKRKDIDKDFEGINIQSFVCIPVSNKYDAIGCIEFIKENGKFTEEEADICEMMANLAAIQIEDEEKFQQASKNLKTIIEVRDVKKEFKNGEFISQVLKGVNLDVYEGEFLVLLGESGCGKSTLLNVISGMDRPTSGSIKFNNEEISRLDQADLTQYRRDNIGFIFQSYNLMPNLNVKDNLDLIGELVKNPMDSIEALKLVKLDQKANSYPGQLSGGQQQRVSIARALIKNPRIIMADEPTAALDYETSIEVLSALEEIKNEGTTLVMVTHNEEITKMADRVVRMRNGKTWEITVNRHPVHAIDLVW